MSISKTDFDKNLHYKVSGIITEMNKRALSRLSMVLVY